MIAKFKKIPPILLLVFLQCLVPLLHAHPDIGAGGKQGVHAHILHEPIELYCLSSEREPCPELRIAALDTPILVASNELFPLLNGVAPPSGFVLPQGERRLTLSAAAVPDIHTIRFPFIAPLAHAPPRLS
ncbi:MAG: hypothetical protein ABIT92_03285 [Gammaproteobacteria bacterium]